MAKKVKDMDQKTETDFDDIDDTVLREATTTETKPARRRSSTRSGTTRTRKATTAKSGKKGAVASNMKFSDGFKALVMILSAIFLILVVYVLMSSRMYGTALTVGVAGMIIFFLYLFTAGIDRIKMNGMVVYCYLFTSVALIGAILPFFYFDKVVLNQEKMLSSPLGIIKACVKAVGDEQVPPEMDCKREKSQWVLNIGGTIEEKHLKECVTVECMNREKQQHPERYANNNIQITGGLVVPLYVMVFAIIGAAVNMTRRVPEYQRQVYLYFRDSENKSEIRDDQITCEDAREFMVFQLMQVISAPIIAITAYYVIVPQSPNVSVILGFFAGFTSETILIALRAFADKLMPSGVASRTKAHLRKQKAENTS